MFFFSKSVFGSCVCVSRLALFVCAALGLCIDSISLSHK